MRAWGIRLLVLGCAALLWMRCSDSATTVAGGEPGGTFVGNPVMGMVYDSSHTPVAGAVVRLRPRGYLASITAPSLAKGPADRGDTVTGADGRFFFDAIDSGSYLIEVMVDSTRGVLIECNGGSAGDTVELQDATIAPYAQLRGSLQNILLADSGNTVVRVRGLERAVRPTSTGEFVLRVPASPSYTLHIDDVADTRPSVELALRNVAAGDSVVVDTVKAVPLNVKLAGWRFRTKIGINTGVNGAYCGVNVYNFPLLVTIPPNWPVFSQVNRAHGDIRFVKSDGALLPYEVESWDSAGGISALWVMVDTVWRNRSDQYIYMYWGNDTAVASSEAVFTPAKGYLAVWHGGRKAGAQGVVLAQSATLGSDAVGTQSTTSAAGLIGNAVYFDGVDDSLTASLALTKGVTTHNFSCWVKVASAEQSFALFSGKMNDTTPNVFGIYSLFRDSVSYLSLDRFINTAPQLFFEKSNRIEWLEERWYYCLASSYGVNRGTIWVNGVQLDEGSYGGVADEMRKLSLVIGGHGRIGYLRGALDEIRITAQGSENHYQLSYLNQKPSQQLVAWGTIELLQ